MRGFLIDRRRLKERGVYSHNCNKLKKNEKSFKIAEYPLYQLIRQGRQEIHIALSNPNIDVRIFAQGYYVAIVKLSLL